MKAAAPGASVKRRAVSVEKTRLGSLSPTLAKAGAGQALPAAAPAGGGESRRERHEIGVGGIEEPAENEGIDGDGGQQGEGQRFARRAAHHAADGGSDRQRGDREGDGGEGHRPVADRGGRAAVGQHQRDGQQRRQQRQRHPEQDETRASHRRAAGEPFERTGRQDRQGWIQRQHVMRQLGRHRLEQDPGRDDPGEQEQGPVRPALAPDARRGEEGEGRERPRGHPEDGKVGAGRRAVRFLGIRHLSGHVVAD